MTVIATALAVFYTTLLNTSIIAFFIGSIWMIKSFIKDIANDLLFLNFEATLVKSPNISKKRFCNIVHHYSEVKQLREASIND